MPEVFSPESSVGAVLGHVSTNVQEVAASAAAAVGWLPSAVNMSLYF